jgi:hypothetical protein
VRANEVLGRIYRLHSFDTTRYVEKTTRPTILLLVRLFLAKGTCLPSRCLATKGRIHSIEPFPSNYGTDAYRDTQTDGRDL